MTPPRFIPAQIVADPSNPHTGRRWEGLPVSGPISSPYGAYEAARAANGWGEHNATDIAAACGDVIRAAYPGTVHVGFGDGVGGVDEGSLGTFIVLRHEIDGRVFYTGYAHLLMQPMVNPGDWVEQGQAIGLVGYSGNVNPPGPAGAHLHFAVMEGVGYFNRDQGLDTFYDPEQFTGAAPVPTAAPAQPLQPAVGSDTPFITERQSLELQYVLGKGAVALPETVEDTGADYALRVEGQEPKMIPAGTRVYRYTVLVPVEPPAGLIGE